MNILKILTPKRILGNFGERAACKYLKRNGYKILARNYVALGHEIDIIAKNKELTAFVEVKTRSLSGNYFEGTRPSSAVTPEKQRSIIKTAKFYIAENRLDGRVRLDVIEVLTDGTGKNTKVSQIKHLTGAFNIDTSKRRTY